MLALSCQGEMYGRGRMRKNTVYLAIVTYFRNCKDGILSWVMILKSRQKNRLKNWKELINVYTCITENLKHEGFDFRMTSHISIEILKLPSRSACGGGAVGDFPASDFFRHCLGEKPSGLDFLRVTSWPEKHNFEMICVKMQGKFQSFYLRLL